MRDAKIMVRLSEDEQAVLEEAAQGHSLPVSSWSRMELLRVARENGGNRKSPASVAKKPGLLSLFCGPGGLDEGFRQAGFATSVAIDISEPAVETFKFNHRDARAAVRDITKVSLEDLDELHGQTLKPIGVLGGPPCQSFSFSNVHQRDDDPRHRLPEAYAALLSKLNKRSPISFFVFENVLGLLGERHRHRYEQFKKACNAAGFSIVEQEMNAIDYGVPQDRPRIIIVGINRKLHPGKQWTPPKPDGGRMTVAQTIAGLAPPVENGPGLNPETFPVHPNHWCFAPKSRKFVKGLQQGEMWGRSFRTLTWDKPSWTVAYGHREMHVHPTGKRRVSIYEAMLLQTFPEDYRLLGTITAQCTLVSEAVPPKMARRIAHSIRESLGI